MKKSQYVAIGDDYFVAVTKVPRDFVAVERWRLLPDLVLDKAKIFYGDTLEQAMQYAKTLTSAEFQKMRYAGVPREIEMWIRYGLKYPAVGGKFKVPDHLHVTDVSGHRRKQRS